MCVMGSNRHYWVSSLLMLLVLRVLTCESSLGVFNIHLWVSTCGIWWGKKIIKNATRLFFNQKAGKTMFEKSRVFGVNLIRLNFNLSTSLLIMNFRLVSKGVLIVKGSQIFTNCFLLILIVIGGETFFTYWSNRFDFLNVVRVLVDSVRTSRPLNFYRWRKSGKNNFRFHYSPSAFIIFGAQ